MLCPIATIPKNGDFFDDKSSLACQIKHFEFDIFFASAVTKSALLRITAKVT